MKQFNYKLSDLLNLSMDEFSTIYSLACRGQAIDCLNFAKAIEIAFGNRDLLNDTVSQARGVERVPDWNALKKIGLGKNAGS